MDVIPAGDACPVDFASATEDVGPLLPVTIGDDVTYCFKVINNGPGDAFDVEVTHPQTGAVIALGDIPAGGEAMAMTDDVIEEGDGVSTATVTGNNAAGDPVDPADDPAGVDPADPPPPPPVDPSLDIRLDVIPAGDACPVDFASGTEDVGPLLPCLLYTSPSPRDATLSRMPSSA